MRALLLLAQIYWPLALALAALIVAFFARPTDDTVKIDLAFIPFVKVPVLITSGALRRILLCIGALILGFFFVFRDYSFIFPKRLLFSIYYDHAGIRASLNGLPDAQLRALGRSGRANSQGRTADEVAREALVFELLDYRVRQAEGVASFDGFARRAVTSKGHTDLFVDRVSMWHIYEVTKADGEIEHTIDLLGHRRQLLKSYFELRPTHHARIRMYARDMLAGREVLLTLSFKQALPGDPRDIFQLSVTTFTGVRIFPVPRISNTVYVAEIPEQGLVPFGYADYNF